MKKLILVLAIITTSAIIFSCKDIMDLGDNISKTPFNPTNSKDDSLSLLDLTPIVFGNVRNNQTLFRNVILNNNSGQYTILIYDIRLKNNLGFEIYPEKGYPVVIAPNQNNYDNPIIAKWVINTPGPGFYQDTVILNESMNMTVLINGNVTN